MPTGGGSGIGSLDEPFKPAVEATPGGRELFPNPRHPAPNGSGKSGDQEEAVATSGA